MSRKTTFLDNSLEKNYSGSRYIIHCKEVRNIVCKSTISGENTKSGTNVKRTVFTSTTGSFVNVGKRSIQKVLSTQGQFLSNLFHVEKKDGGKCPVINLKPVRPVLSI